MPLDMFGQAQSDTNAYVQRNNAPRLPATFGDTFDAAWNENRLFGQSVAGENSRAAALGDYMDDVTRKTGEQFADLPFELGATSLLLPHVNDKVAKLKAANPDLAIDDLTPEGLDQRAIAKSKAARADFHEMQAREKTLGGSLGSLTGAAAGSLTDPVNLVVAPLAAPEGLGLLATALAWGAIGGGSQAAIEAIGSPYRETVSPGYGASGEPARNVLGAAAFGGAAGGFFKGLGMAWGRAKTGVWPRSIRDAGNVVESEAQVAQSNVLSIPPPAEGFTRFYHGGDDAASGGARWVTPNYEYARDYRPGEKVHYVDIPNDHPMLKKSFDDTGTDQVAPFVSFEAPEEIAKKLKPYTHGLEGEVAHRDALAKTIDDVVAGRRVDVPENITAAHEAKLDALMAERAGSRAAAEEAKAAPVEPAPELPLEPTTPELHQATIADGVQNIARMAGHDMPREEAEKLAKMVAGASDDERARAILSAVFDRPQTVAEFPPSPLPAVASYVAANRAAAVEAAGKMGLTERVAEMARAGKTAKEISEALNGRLSVDDVRAVRDNLGIDAAGPLMTPGGATLERDVAKTVASPEFEQALRADIDRARATGDVKIPAGVDEKGDPVFRSVDAAMNEIDAYKAAAEQIKACANPVREAAE